MACYVLFLVLFGRFTSGFAESDGACEACDSTDGVNWLQVKEAVTSSSARLIEADSNRSPPTKEKPRRLQNFHTTAWNRYPTIFRLLKDLLDDVGKAGKPAKLLSFGCSDGSECHSLRTYFPDAIIHGVDIAADLIAENIANNTDSSIDFYDNTANLSTESYDAVLAMSVLLHQGSSVSKHLSYDEYVDTVKHLAYHKYVDAVTVLDRLVRPGGYLVIYNADHPFSEYPHHHDYKNMEYHQHQFHDCS